LRIVEALVGLVASFNSKYVGTEEGVGVLTCIFNCLRLCGKEGDGIWLRQEMPRC
jgi:hypothetical protein